MQLTIRLKTKTIIVGICVCNMRTADVSPRSSPLSDVSRGGTKRPSAAMSEPETFAVRRLFIACVAFKTSFSTGHQHKLGSVTALTDFTKTYKKVWILICCPCKFAQWIKCLVMFLILNTTLFHEELTLKGEIWCWLLLTGVDYWLPPGGGYLD